MAGEDIKYQNILSIRKKCKQKDQLSNDNKNNIIYGNKECGVEIYI